MFALVTGGTGFVGSHLIEELRARGDRVRAVVRPGGNCALVESFGAEAVSGSLEDADSLRAACTGCDVVYHAAARVEIYGPEAEFERTTVQGTANILDAAIAAGVRRFVQVSSCGVYHPRLFAAGQVIDEATPTPPAPRWFPYGRAKLKAEAIVRERCPPEFEWVIVRLGYLYGPRNRTMREQVLPAMTDSTMRILGRGDNVMAFIFVKDVVKALARAGHAPAAARQILIAAGNERITQKEYFDALADGFGIPRCNKHIPYSVAYFFGWLGELVIRSGPRRATLRRAAIALTGLPQRVNCERTQGLLEWSPETRFADGMRETFEWYRKAYPG
jgi:nucleoside-diphosphate-sugar epimerase